MTMNLQQGKLLRIKKKTIRNWNNSNNGKYFSVQKYRFHLMYVGREWQGMFVDARERVIKTIMFYRCLRKDMENWIDYDKTLKKSINKVKVNC